jgi:lysophospholipase L1-like esterase
MFTPLFQSVGGGGDLPDPPEDFTATQAGPSSIDLEWVDASSNEDNFEIQRSDDGITGWVTIDEPAEDATSYTDTGLESVTEYFYRIRSVNSAGGSDWVEASATTASSFSPLDLSPVAWWSGAGTLWQDSARTTPATVVNDPIGAADDASVNARHLLQATDTKRPLLKSVTNGGKTFLVIETDGVNDFLKKTFTLNQPVFYVAVMKPMSAPATLAYWDGNTNLTGALYTSNGEDTNLYAGAGQVGTLPHGLWSLIEAYLNGASSSQLLNSGPAPTTGNAGAGNPGGFTLGALADGSLPSNSQYSDILILSTEPSAANKDLLRDFFGDKCGLSYWSKQFDTRPFIMFDGNSMTSNGPPFAFDPAAAYPTKVAASLGSAWQVVNESGSGQTTPQMTAAAPTSIDYLTGHVTRRNVLVAWEMGNHIELGGANAADAYAAMVTYCTGRTAADYDVIVMSETPRNNGFNATILAANALLRADFTVATAQANVFLPNPGVTYARLFIDLAVDTRLDDATDATYNADGTHLTDAGYTVVADYVVAALPLIA